MIPETAGILPKSALILPDVFILNVGDPGVNQELAE